LLWLAVECAELPVDLEPFEGELVEA
jgi:hypothetical protein